MSAARVIIACSFEATDEIKGLHGTKKLRGAARDKVYEQLKRVVLQAGRFSTFEACGSRRAAALFTQLDNDPEVERFDLPFPWEGVRRRAAIPKALEPLHVE